MRVVEFRAWDIDKQEYITWFEIGCEGCITTQEPNCSPDYPNAILEQYTGFKDRSGKKIYEGDIVKVDGRIYEVAWFEHAGGWFCFRKNDSEHKPLYYLKSEVIGNVHENPGLIKEEQE